ncbi:hypothetical protein [Paenibacillus xylanexedens]|uniref:hypothetical protein n=1 Tax=Paenibacillus xylanexedens TaxID=528191 RepID=UPI0011A6D6D3|nr:hypothetical protein [Paenibacillus xylanexedens]
MPKRTKTYNSVSMLNTSPGDLSASAMYFSMFGVNNDTQLAFDSTVDQPITIVDISMYMATMKATKHTEVDIDWPLFGIHDNKKPRWTSVHHG